MHTPHLFALSLLLFIFATSCQSAPTQAPPDTQTTPKSAFIQASSSVEDEADDEPTEKPVAANDVQAKMVVSSSAKGDKSGEDKEVKLDEGSGMELDGDEMMESSEDLSASSLKDKDEKFLDEAGSGDSIDADEDGAEAGSGIESDEIEANSDPSDDAKVGNVSLADEPATNSTENVKLQLQEKKGGGDEDDDSDYDSDSDDSDDDSDDSDEDSKGGSNSDSPQRRRNEKASVEKAVSADSPVGEKIDPKDERIDAAKDEPKINDAKGGVKTDDGEDEAKIEASADKVDGVKEDAKDEPKTDDAKDEAKIDSTADEPKTDDAKDEAQIDETKTDSATGVKEAKSDDAKDEAKIDDTKEDAKIDDSNEEKEAKIDNTGAARTDGEKSEN